MVYLFSLNKDNTTWYSRHWNPEVIRMISPSMKENTKRAWWRIGNEVSQLYKVNTTNEELQNKITALIGFYHIVELSMIYLGNDSVCYDGISYLFAVCNVRKDWEWLLRKYSEIQTNEERETLEVRVTKLHRKLNAFGLFYVFPELNTFYDQVIEEVDSYLHDWWREVIKDHLATGLEYPSEWREKIPYEAKLLYLIRSTEGLDMKDSEWRKYILSITRDYGPEKKESTESSKTHKEELSPSEDTAEVKSSKNRKKPIVKVALV